MNERIQPAFWGGLFIGVLSAVPPLSLGNCCCCLWVLCGGALAAYLRQQNSPTQIEAAEGALVGLMAGAIGGVIGTVIMIPVTYFLGPFQQQIMERVLSGNPNVPPEMRETIDRMNSTGFGVVRTIISLMVTMVIDVVFGMIGGLLGVALFKKKTPPPGTVEVLPPA